MKKSLSALGVSSVALFCLEPVTSCSYETSPRKGLPNIIVILTDDQGYGDLGCYGSTNVLLN